MNFDFREVTSVHIGDDNIIEIRDSNGNVLWQAVQQPNNEIWYQTTDDAEIRIDDSKFHANLVSQSFDGKKWVAVFDDDLTSIDNGAFFNQTRLVKVELPNSITNVGNVTTTPDLQNGVFEGCENLARVKMPRFVEEIGDKCFMGTAISTFNMGSNVETFGTFVFAQTTNIQSVKFNANMIEIPPHTFDHSSISTFSVPETITTIGDHAFEGSELTNINLNENISVIEIGAFLDCGSLESIDLEGVVAIGDDAFANCVGLTELILPETITTIGDYGFSGCMGLEEIHVKNETPFTIGQYAFDNTNDCPILVHADYVTDYKDAWVDYAERIAEDGVPANQIWYTTTGETISNNYRAESFAPAIVVSNTYVNGKGILEFDRPLQTLSEGGYAFNRSADWKTIDLPEGITRIGCQAFESLSNLEYIKIPNTVTEIGNHAFQDCPKVEYIILGSSLERLDGLNTFRVEVGCQYIKSLNPTPPNIGTSWSNSFKGTEPQYIFVPAESVEIYKTTSGWKNKANIILPIPEE